MKRYLIDDLSLLPVVQQRISDWRSNPDNVVEMSRDELRHIARGVTLPKLNVNKCGCKSKRESSTKKSQASDEETAEKI